MERFKDALLVIGCAIMFILGFWYGVGELVGWVTGR